MLEQRSGTEERNTGLDRGGNRRKDQQRSVRESSQRRRYSVQVCLKTVASQLSKSESK